MMGFAARSDRPLRCQKLPDQRAILTPARQALSASDKDRSIEDRETRIAVEQELPEEVMLHFLSMIKNWRPPITIKQVQRIFGDDPSGHTLNRGSIVESYDIAPGYKMRFAYSGDYILQAAYIERTLPEFLFLGKSHVGNDSPDPTDEEVVAMERYALINPKWTAKGLVYVLEISDDGNEKTKLVPFSTLSRQRSGEQGGADQAATAAGGKSKGNKKPKPKAKPRPK